MRRHTRCWREYSSWQDGTPKPERRLTVPSHIFSSKLTSDAANDSKGVSGCAKTFKRFAT
jgi:hypothetical protein